MLESEVRVCVCSRACHSQSRRPQTLAASPRLAQPGARLPPCQTDTDPLPGARPLRPSTLLAMSSCLFSSACISRRPTRTRPTCIRPTKHRLPFFPTHSPFLSAQSFYFPFPIHYITLLYLTLIARHISVQRNNTGARHCSRFPTSARVLSFSVSLCLPFRPRHRS